MYFQFTNYFEIPGHVKEAFFMMSYYSISGCVRVFEKISMFSSTLSGTRDNHNNTYHGENWDIRGFSSNSGVARYFT